MLVEIDRQTLTGSSGGFDFTLTPNSNTKRLVIKGWVRSDFAAVGDNWDIKINSDTTSTNYHRANLWSLNGTANFSEAVQYNHGSQTAASSPTGQHAIFEGVIENPYGASEVKQLNLWQSAPREAAAILAGKHYIRSSVTDAITRLRFDPSNGTNWTGVMIVYEEQVSDPYWDNVQLLLEGEGSEAAQVFTDSSQNALVPTVTGSTSQAFTTLSSPKVGSSSMAFVNGGQLNYGDATAVPGLFLDGDFTIETYLWMNNSTGTGEYPILLPGGQQLYIGGSGLVQFFGQGSISLTIGSGLSFNTWYHVAITRSGDDYKVYLNGTYVTGTTNSTTVTDDTTDIRIGGLISPTRFLDGKLDSLRITKGVARYTTTGSFNPNLDPFPTQ